MLMFALSIVLGIAGLLTLQWSFLAGAVMIIAAVGIHARLARSAEDFFVGWLVILAAIGVAAEVGADLWRRIFS